MKKLLALAVFLFIARHAHGGDWPRFRNGNGICDEKLTLLPAPTKVWTASVGEGNASLVVKDGRIYTVGRDRARGRELICLNAKTGKIVWRRRLDLHHCDSSPVVDDGKIFLLCHGPKLALRCFNAKDGSDVWECEVTRAKGNRSYGHAGSPLLWKDRVIVNVGHGAAVDRKTGKLLWQHEGLPGLATPVYFREGDTDGVLIFAGAELIARDARTGKQLWSIPWKTNIAVNACDPIYHDGKVFISTTYGLHAALFDVKGREPKKLWKVNGSSFSSGFLWKDHLYCFTGGRFSCLELGTGERNWFIDGIGGGSAILVDGKIILLSERGKLRIAPVSSSELRPVVTEQVHGGTNWTPPSYADGHLFVRNKEGGAVCLKIGK